jgi:hypothetical protein
MKLLGLGNEMAPPENLVKKLKNGMENEELHIHIAHVLANRKIPSGKENGGLTLKQNGVGILSNTDFHPESKSLKKFATF